MFPSILLKNKEEDTRGLFGWLEKKEENSV
jgi:hypothetical protein